jgi:hypothetical protein
MFVHPDLTSAIAAQHTRELHDAAAHARRVREARLATSTRHARAATRVTCFRLRPVFSRIAHGVLSAGPTTRGPAPTGL